MIANTDVTNSDCDALHCDVLIAGGGMVGVSFALALDTAAKGALKIVLAEGFAIPPSTQSAPIYRPSFDARATALAHGSRVILEQLGVWKVLAPHATAITDIHVSERDCFGSAELPARKRPKQAVRERGTNAVHPHPRVQRVLHRERRSVHELREEPVRTEARRVLRGRERAG